MNELRKIRVFIVDPHPTIRRGLEVQLTSASHVETIGQAESARQVFDALEETDVDVVLTGIRLDDMSGLELTRRLKEDRPERAVVIVTADEHYIEHARTAGADGYVLQDRVDGQLVEAIDMAARGASYFRKP